MNEVSVPIGMEDGINFHENDASKATLVLSAPTKDFVYVSGSFNNYNPGEEFLMNQDPTTGKFWLEINNLTQPKLIPINTGFMMSDPVERFASNCQNCRPLLYACFVSVR